ncbi:hypothetical protein BDZ89DRAFT_277660 [Hymenopellis radicata]|nr:hypothetical protein BDZ89DRAFT_277660 [Hymenopellis radicata]
MAVLLAASLTYYDDKKAVLKHWSDINAPEYHTTISNDLTALCLPGVKKKHKWIDADGVVSLWWLGRNSDGDVGPKFHLGLERLNKYVNPKEGSEEFQMLLLCKIKSISILEQFVNNALSSLDASIFTLSQK